MLQLKRISDTVQQVAEAISVALKVDVEIVDLNNIRIGATGQIKEMIGEKQQNGHVSRFVQRTGESVILENPGLSRICQGCQLHNNCYYTSGVFSPVKVNGEVIGVISLIAFDQQKKLQIIENKNQYLKFIEKMANLITSKLMQQQLYELLELKSKELDTVLNSVHEGIILADLKGKINYINKFAQLHLHLKPENVIGKPVVSVLGNNSILFEAVRNRKTITEQHVVYRNDKVQEISLYSKASPIFINHQFKGAVETFQLTDELKKIFSRLDNETKNALDDILGKSIEINKLKTLIPKLSESPSNVLINGESGTGKELVARAIHQCGPRKNYPFIAINCSAIPDSLLESELFGYESGAFTGANKGGKIGKFELAHKGTLFLDEIGDLPFTLQAKILRVIQEREIQRVGGSKSTSIDVRIIAAAHKDLETMVTEKEFREDLFYRLNVVPLNVPPLNKRKEDIPLLVDHLIQRANLKLQKNFTGCSIDVLEAFISYDWPGNIRELENAIEYICNLETNSRLTIKYVPEKIMNSLQSNSSFVEMKTYSLKEAVQTTEKSILEKILSLYSINTDLDKILQTLHISRATLYRKLKEYKISHN